MATGNETHIAHIGGDVFEEYAQGQGAVVGMWPELDVLMPFDFLAAPGRFEVQLAVVKLDIRPDQVFDYVYEDGLADEFPERGMQVRRGDKSTQARVLRRMVRLQVE